MMISMYKRCIYEICHDERRKEMRLMLRDLTLVGERNELLFIRVWKPLPTRGVLKH